MTTRSLALGALTSLVALAGPAGASEWQLSPPHSTATFSVKHMMVTTVRGRFQKVTGTVHLDDADVTKSSVRVNIDPATIDTGVTARDSHLRSADFFDVARFPEMRFQSTRVERSSDGKLRVTGDLTMHGQTHPVVLLVEGPTGGAQLRGVSATGKLNRKEWGLTWNKAIEAGGVAVGEEVTLQIDAELEPVQQHASR